MPHPLETAADLAFDRLRAFAGRAEALPGHHILPGIWIAADTRDGAVQAAVEALPGGGLRLDLAVARPGRWLSLNVALDLAPLAAGEVLGVVAALAGTVPGPIGVSIRSGHARGHVDMTFPDRLEVGATPRAHVALLGVTAAMVPPDPPAWRNLMLHLPMRDLQLDLAEMRLFVQPAAAEAARADA